MSERLHIHREAEVHPSPGATHLVPADARVVADASPDRSVVVRCASRREPAIKDSRHPFSLALLGAAASNASVEGISTEELIELLRYDFHFAIEEELSLLYDLSQGLEGAHACREVVLTPARGPAPFGRFVRALREDLWDGGVSLSLEAEPHPGKLRAIVEESVRRATEEYWIFEQFSRRGWASTPPPRRAKFASFEYYPNSSKLAASSCAELRRLGEDAVVVAGRPSVATALRRFGAKSLRLEPAPVDLLLTALKLRRSSLPVIDWRCVVPERLRRFPRALAEATRSAFLRTSGPALGYWERIESSLRVIRPEAVATTTFASSFGRALALVARRARIPSLYLQHGLLGPERFFSHQLADHVCLWGEENRRDLVSHGFPSDRVHVVGRPGANRGVPPREPGDTVLYLASRRGGSMVSESASDDALLWTERAAASLGRSLLVRTHPADNFRWVEAQLGRPGTRWLPANEGHVATWIARAGVAVVLSSTTGLEVCEQRVPLVVLQPRGVPVAIDYARFEAALVVRSEAELEPALRSAFEDQVVRDRLEAGGRRLAEAFLGPNGLDPLAEFAAVMRRAPRGTAGRS